MNTRTRSAVEHQGLTPNFWNWYSDICCYLFTNSPLFCTLYHVLRCRHKYLHIWALIVYLPHILPWNSCAYNVPPTFIDLKLKKLYEMIVIYANLLLKISYSMWSNAISKGRVQWRVFRISRIWSFKPSVKMVPLLLSNDEYLTIHCIYLLSF